MAEIRVNVTASKPQRVNVSSSNISTEITATPDSSLYYSNLAKNWAIASGLVLNEDYSSKHYAGKAKESENASKNYAEASQAVYQRVQDSANDVLDNIETNKNSAIEEIETIKTNAVNTANEANTTISTNKTNAINEINTTKNSAVSSVNTTKTSAITEINNTKTTAVNAVNTSKNQALVDIEKESGSIINFKEEVNAELENKVDVDDMVAFDMKEVPCITESYVNGTSGYIVYSNGYCEQWGYLSAGKEVTVNLLKAYANTDYNMLTTPRDSGATTNYRASLTGPTLTSFRYVCTAAVGAYWRTTGYIA